MTLSTLEYAVEEAARFAVVNNSATAAEIQTVVSDSAAGLDATQINVAITFAGLKRLGLPQASLLTFPQEFVSGMQARRSILGDDLGSAPENWDPVWKDPQRIHILVWMNGQASSGERAPDVDPLNSAFKDLLATAATAGRVRQFAACNTDTSPTRGRPHN